MTTEEHVRAGVAAQQRGDTATAETAYRAALEAEPEHPEALRLLGSLLGDTARPYEAVPYLEKALRFRPDLASTWLDLGQAIQSTSATRERMADGLVYTLTGLSMAPAFAPAHWNAALGLLSLGEWSEGWREYEYGYLCDRRKLRTTRGKLWKGEWVGPDTTIFVHWEQGYGDTLCWLRLLPLLKERSGARVVLEVQRALYPLLSQCRGAVEAADEVRAFNPDDLDDVPPFDFRTSLLSLPHRLGVTPENVGGEAYIRVGEWASGRGGEVLVRADSGLRVGLCWRGNAEHANDRNRSMTFEALRPLFGIEECAFYSLQWGEQPGGGPGVKELPLDGFDVTACYVAELDLVATVDTSVAHLAGAMGKETWVMLPYSPDYRWLLERDDTPLYRSARLFRQDEPGGWDGVVGRVREALAARVRAARRDERGGEEGRSVFRGVRGVRTASAQS